MVDESNLASTQQVRAFLNKIAPQDRVLLIGDTRQHQGVDALRFAVVTVLTTLCLRVATRW
jgi:hypothetical protein